MEEKNTTSVNKIPWHRNFKWWHILLISLFSGFLYFATGMAIFDYILVIGFIYSIVLAVKSRKKSG